MALFNDDPIKQYSKLGKNYVKEQQKLKDKKAREALKLQKREEEIKRLNEKTSKSLKKYGFEDPSQTTITAIINNNVFGKMDNVLNSINMLTFDTTKQMLHNFFITELNQNFVSQVQNDKLIKQNEKLINQNEKIIELLTEISKK
ncbi:hypothetical protein [Staphylococcus auricularis]|uniref:Uncharacterized protein n=1 Tax=Staphylococcus auricularis TaxID=29379 RepID=A0ABX5IDP3_9STAP|nr:hypothetical protein [Staphylococcus auricularis]MCE5037581.1 hypothetical protein [Staphylococcus auricularis]MEB6569896.1 hypothetical protein [Staphylococcus auricularis]PTH13129.1 hypothetical protein BU607_09900 [Staphylococcus auricularis]PTH27395.1 hypothetical protein BU608_02475 [Staphylococcus auricularis]